MSDSITATGAQQKTACCTPKRAVYATAVTLVALAVIIGVLVVVSHYTSFRLPVVSSIAHQLGQYSFVPLVASGGLLLLLGSLGIYQKCTSQEKKIPRFKDPANGGSVSGSESSSEGEDSASVSRYTNKPRERRVGETYLMAQLPEWLSGYMTNVPCLEFPKPVKLGDLERITHPIFMTSRGSNRVIHMRLIVKHVCVDSSYDRARKNEEYEGQTISSKEPFVLRAIVWLPVENDVYRADSWELTSFFTCIEHRNADFDAANILGNSQFRYSSQGALSKAEIGQLVNTENQDNLPTQYRHHLGWVLLRLLAGGHLIVREQRADGSLHSIPDIRSYSFDGPALGYWEISIAGST